VGGEMNKNIEFVRRDFVAADKFFSGIAGMEVTTLLQPRHAERSVETGCAENNRRGA